MSGWGKPGQPGQQGWGQQGQQQQGWGQQGQQQQGWGQQGQQGQQGQWGKPAVNVPGQQQQGWGQQGAQQGQWGQQGQQGQQGWGQQGQQGQWGQQGQQGQQGWGQQGQQGWGQQGQNQGFGQQGQNQGFGQQTNQASLFNPNQDYSIFTALDDDKVADVSQGNDNTRFKLILWHKSGDKNQRFRFRAVGNGKYQILSNAGGALQVPNGAGSNGIQLLSGQNSNSPSEFFEIYPAQGHSGGYFIKTFCGKMLDLCEGKESKGTPIIQWDYNGQKNQVWYIKPI